MPQSRVSSEVVVDISTEYVELRARRVRTVLIACIGVMVLIISHYSSTGKDWGLVAIDTVGALVLIAGLLLQRRGHTNIATFLLIATLMATTAGFMWGSEGIHDLAFAVFPGILVFSSMLLERRHFIALFMLVALEPISKLNYRMR